MEWIAQGDIFQGKLDYFLSQWKFNSDLNIDASKNTIRLAYVYNTGVRRKSSSVEKRAEELWRASHRS